MTSKTPNPPAPVLDSGPGKVARFAATYAGNWDMPRLQPWQLQLLSRLEVLYTSKGIHTLVIPARPRASLKASSSELVRLLLSTR